MKKKRLLLVSLVVLALLLLAGCAAGLNPTVDVPDTDGDIAGFWSGLWHGFISPITFIISLFSECSVSALSSAVGHAERCGSLNKYTQILLGGLRDWPRDIFDNSYRLSIRLGTHRLYRRPPAQGPGHTGLG